MDDRLSGSSIRQKGRYPQPQRSTLLKQGLHYAQWRTLASLDPSTKVLNG